jgi:two-component SAPR family response regulator
MADENMENSSVEISMCQHPDVIRILEAVDRPKNLEEFRESAICSYSIVIELFGYPVAKNFGGEIAVFRKKKALELLVWLSLNRDRARRSNARTAMWESDVTDATFSTILSDMRRSLFELDQTLGNCAPATYTDVITLSNQIVTDSELLGQAYSQFKNHKGDLENVLVLLSAIRDIPFAGTSYIWADLDGTTTRLIIQVMTICLDVSQLAIEARDSHALNIAITAGLRVFPGHEELSEIQSRFLAETVQQGSRSVA